MKIIISFLLIAAFSYVSGFESSEKRDTEKYLKQFYDFDKKNDNFEDTLKTLQKMAGIKADGKLSDEVVSHLNKGRCGGKDKKKKSKRYNLGESKWDIGKTYNYYIHKTNAPTTMEWGYVRRGVWKGLSYWEEVSKIAFQESGETRGSSFSVSFGGPNHLQYDVSNNFKSSVDPYTLGNEPGGVLAHAFFPRNGNLHYDTAETWTAFKDDGINLRIVTAHEMGHAIGLHHSNDPTALMAPWYGGYISEEKYKLPDDDTKGAQSLYGSRGKRSVRSVKREVGKIQAQLCAVSNFEGAFKFKDDKVYVAADGGKIFRLSDGKVDETFQPTKLDGDLADADSMFYDNLYKRLIVFKGEKVFELNGDNVSDLKAKEMKVISSGGYQGKSSAAFARFSTPDSGISHFWIVEEKSMLSGFVQRNSVLFSRRPREVGELIEMSNGAKLPPSIDAAFVDGHKDEARLMLFVGNSVYVGKPQGRKQAKFLVTADYPKSFKQILGC